VKGGAIKNLASAANKGINKRRRKKTGAIVFKDDDEEGGSEQDNAEDELEYGEYD
jgi:hypothetical protein